MKVFGAVLVIVLLVWLVPLLGIWTINVLWDVGAPYDFTHWLAALIFSSSLVAGGASSSK